MALAWGQIPKIVDYVWVCIYIYIQYNVYRYNHIISSINYQLSTINYQLPHHIISYHNNYHIILIHIQYINMRADYRGGWSGESIDFADFFDI